MAAGTTDEDRVSCVAKAMDGEVDAVGFVGVVVFSFIYVLVFYVGLEPKAPGPRDRDPSTYIWSREIDLVHLARRFLKISFDAGIRRWINAA